jgi:hypothetical protein
MNEQSQHEPIGIHSRPLLLWGAALLALVCVALAVAEGLHRRLVPHRPAASATAPGSARPAESSFAAPLDSRQQAQRAEYEAEQRRLLSTYGWIDEEQRIARIPIDRAIELLPEKYQVDQ